MKNTPTVSIIIRSKNEEKWINSCLASVFRQEYKNFEVILVDNNSVDRTVEKASKFPISQTISIDAYLPGDALNIGVRASKGDYFVCLSAHCIPANTQWLGNLLAAFDDDSIAGVYGKQEPMMFTPDVDKRDLYNTFGLDKRIHINDPFFHNANSMIRRDVWERFPFSETTTNIEDRIWAKEVLANGYVNVYEPSASVYHYHGINQGRNIERARNVVRILEELHPESGGKLRKESFKTYALIPCRGQVKAMGDTSLLEMAIRSLQPAKCINKILVTSENHHHLEIAESLGAEAIERPKELSYDYIELGKVYEYITSELISRNDLPDNFFLAQERYPFRPVDLADKMVEQMVNSNCDCVIAAQYVYNSLWKFEEDTHVPLDEGPIPSKFKTPISQAMYGLGCVMTPGLIIEGKKVGRNTGLVMVNNTYSGFIVRNDEDLEIANLLSLRWHNLQQKD